MSDSPPAAPEETLLKFPTDFPVKIMGQASDDFRSLVMGIVTRHFGTLAPERIEERPSSNGKYLSITVTVVATSKAQLDALYMELTSCSQVLVALWPDSAGSNRSARSRCGAMASPTSRTDDGPPSSLTCVISSPA
jgi:putative lipoic acid-binding regulatory protein